MSGKTLCVLADPPKLGDELTLLVRLRVIEEATSQKESGDQTHIRKTRLIGAWVPGTPPPIDTSQGSLWDQAPPAGSIPPETPPDDEPAASDA